VVVLDGPESTNTGTHRDTNSMAVLFSDRKTGIPQRIDTRGNAIVHENIHAPGISLWKILGNIKVRNRARDLRGKRAYIEVFEFANAGPALTNIVPGSFKLVAHRGNDSHAGNDDTSLTQVIIRVVVAELPSSMNGFKKLAQRSSTAPT